MKRNSRFHSFDSSWLQQHQFIPPAALDVSDGKDLLGPGVHSLLKEDCSLRLTGLGFVQFS